MSGGGVGCRDCVIFTANQKYARTAPSPFTPKQHAVQNSGGRSHINHSLAKGPMQ